MLKDFDDISHNIDKNAYPQIGSGSGRNVYDLGNGCVVKKARNYKGVAQNRAENIIYSHSHSDIFAKIVAVSENYNYLIMVKAEKLESMVQVWNYYHVRNAREFFRTNQFRDISMNYELLPNDLYRITSWGIINGRPVIVDYGFTRETRKYYKPFQMTRFKPRTW